MPTKQEQIDHLIKRVSKLEDINCDCKKNNSPSYLVYSALITEEGEFVQANILENNLGGEISWENSGTGYYTGTLPGAFKEDKTAIITGGSLTFPGVTIRGRRVNDNQVALTVNNGALGINGVFSDTFVEIRIYN